MAKSARTCHSDDEIYNDEEAAFLKEAERFRQEKGRKFLVAVEYLRVRKAMGYVKLSGEEPK